MPKAGFVLMPVLPATPVAPPAATAQSAGKQVTTSKLTLLAVSLGSLLLMLLVALCSLSSGDYPLSWPAVINALLAAGSDTSTTSSTADFIVWQLRLPRLFVALLAGAALGVAGCIVQSVTRNPLASPCLLGVSSGAAFFIVLGIVCFELNSRSHLLFGIAGGGLAALCTFSLAWRSRLDPVQLVLAGMCMSLFFAAGITVLLLSDHADARSIYYWLTGSVANRSWLHVQLLAPLVLAGLLLAMLYARPLNVLQLDEQSASSLGIRPLRWRLVLGSIAVLLTAATVVVTGPLAFVGLIAPHLVRRLPGRLSGHHHRSLLPLSACAGALLVSAADLLARYQEVPVGILTVLLGGPLFVLLISHQQRCSRR